MSVRLTRFISSTAVALFWSCAAFSQGFASLGSSAEGFAQPSRGNGLSFPRDHSAHPRFRIEWWYLTANLQDSQDRMLGVQWTLFRSALRPDEASGWANPQIWMGHAAVTTSGTHLTAERLARGGTGAAGTDARPFQAWIGNWQMESPSSSLNELQVTAAGPEFSYDLALNATTPLILHGDAGYSVKSAKGQASHYYSQPGYEVSGTVTINGTRREVSGQGWFDHEWSSQPLAPDQSGWDWFSLRFESGEKLMGFALRGSEAPYMSGTYIGADGTAVPLGPGEFRAKPLPVSPGSASPAPTVWQVQAPRQGIDVKVEALNPGSWVSHSFTYWEGPVIVSGNRSGKGYLEMTGYK